MVEGWAKGQGQNSHLDQELSPRIFIPYSLVIAKAVLRQEYPLDTTIPIITSQHLLSSYYVPMLDWGTKILDHEVTNQ